MYLNVFGRNRKARRSQSPVIGYPIPYTMTNPACPRQRWYKSGGPWVVFNLRQTKTVIDISKENEYFLTSRSTLARCWRGTSSRWTGCTFPSSCPPASYHPDWIPALPGTLPHSDQPHLNPNKSWWNCSRNTKKLDEIVLETPNKFTKLFSKLGKGARSEACDTV